MFVYGPCPRHKTKGTWLVSPGILCWVTKPRGAENCCWHQYRQRCYSRHLRQLKLFVLCKQRSSRQEWRTMWTWQTLMLTGSSALVSCSPFLLRLHGWAGGSRLMSWGEGVRSCLHTTVSIPTHCTFWGRKTRSGREKVGLGTRAGDSALILPFFSLVESIESDNKLNYFSPSQTCSAHDGNWQVNLPIYTSNHEPFQFILLPVLLRKDDEAAEWVSKVNPSQSQPLSCNLKLTIIWHKKPVLYEPLFSS